MEGDHGEVPNEHHDGPEEREVSDADCGQPYMEDASVDSAEPALPCAAGA